MRRTGFLLLAALAGLLPPGGAMAAAPLSPADARLVDCAAYFALRAAEAQRGIAGAKAYVAPARILTSKAKAAMTAAALSEDQQRAETKAAVNRIQEASMAAAEKGQAPTYDEAPCRALL